MFGCTIVNMLYSRLSVLQPYALHPCISAASQQLKFSQYEQEFNKMRPAKASEHSCARVAPMFSIPVTSAYRQSSVALSAMMGAFRVWKHHEDCLRWDRRHMCFPRVNPIEHGRLSSSLSAAAHLL